MQHRKNPTVGSMPPPNRDGKWLVIGDPHGCYDETLELIDRHGDGRVVIFVGDLVDKGPRPHRVVELVKVLGAKCALGNHEDNHVRYAAHEARRRATGKKNPMKRDAAFKDTHSKLAESRLGLIPFMQSFPHFIRLKYVGPQHSDVVVLHGGLLPGHTPESMDWKKIIRVRNVHVDGKFANLDECSNDPSLPFWTELYDGDDWIIYGHAPFLNPRVQNRTVGLDTGCVYGNRLTGIKLPEMELVQVDARREYVKKEKWDG